MKKTIVMMVFVACFWGCNNEESIQKMDAKKASEIVQDVRCRNLAYEPLMERDDTLMTQVVEYYNVHGTANERMEAYYLLGSVYRDLHESPRAMEAFLKGIEAADTKSNNCRYDILARLYGQRNEILYKQDLIHQAIEEEDSVYKYAILAHDTLFIVNSRWSKIGKLFALGDYRTIADNCWEYLCQSKKLGKYEYAAGLLNTSALACLELGRVDDAERLIDIYERHSGEVNLETHECTFPIYYYTKGRLMLARHRPDSAEMFFRREMCEPDWNNRQSAYRGMRGVFEQTGKVDSALKYARLQCEAVDSDYQAMLSKNLQNLKEMYDYSRTQRDNQRKELLLEQGRRHFHYMLGGTLFTLLCISFAAYYLYTKYRKRVSDAELALEYACAELAGRGNNLTLLRERLLGVGDEQLRNKLERDVEMAEQEAATQRMEVMKKEKELLELQRKSRNSLHVSRQKYHGTVLFQHLQASVHVVSNEDIEEVKKSLQANDPKLLKRLYDTLSKISDTELNTFLLLRMGLTKTEVACAIARTPQGVSSTINRMFVKVFKRECRSNSEAYEWLMNL